jgi:hypothetical protein
MREYQFVAIQYQHDPSAGERINVGLVMWVPDDRKILHYISQRYSRLSFSIDGFDGGAYRPMVRQLANRIEYVSERVQNRQQLDLLEREPTDLHELIEVLCPPDASCFRWAGVMGGLSPDPVQRFDALKDEMIDRHERHVVRERRNEEMIWSSAWLRLERNLRSHGVLDCVERGREIQAGQLKYKFRASWMNGSLQVVEPISLDLADPHRIVDKALLWDGRLHALSRTSKFSLSGIVTGPPDDEELREAWDLGLETLRQAPSVRRIVLEQDLEQLARDIVDDVTASGAKTAST